jgi:hypothetical protein
MLTFDEQWNGGALYYTISLIFGQVIATLFFGFSL